MKRDPKITVYLPSKNCGPFLQEAIESVLAQSISNWELLLIDDASTDQTPEILALYQGDARIRVVRTNGIGLPAVANLALKEAKGDYTIRLDGDDRFDENILLILSHHLDVNPDVALVFPDYYLIDEHGVIYSHERRERLHEKNHNFDIPAHGACTLVRRQVLIDLGGYREDLGAQDGFDIWSKIQASHRCENVNLPLFYYRRHENNLTNNTHRILTARRTIKRDAAEARIKAFGPLLAVIPCRKHYDYSPNLWNQKMFGISLLERAIETCLASDLFDYVVVTSDSKAAAEYVAKMEDSRLIHVARPQNETLRSRSIVPSLERVVRQLDPEAKGVTVLSYIQAPFVTTATLEESLFTLAINDVDSSFAVHRVEKSLFKRSSHGLTALNPDRGVHSDFDEIYLDSRAVLATLNQNFRGGSLLGSKVGHFILEGDENFFIQRQRDLEIARVMYKRIRKDRIASVKKFLTKV